MVNFFDLKLYHFCIGVRIYIIALSNYHIFESNKPLPPSWFLVVGVRIIAVAVLCSIAGILWFYAVKNKCHAFYLIVFAESAGKFDHFFIGKIRFCNINYGICIFYQMQSSHQIWSYRANHSGWVRFAH